MPNPQLLEYIRGQRALGVEKDQISKTLITTGWQVSDINDAFSAIEPKAPAPMPTPVVAPVVQPMPVVQTPSISMMPVSRPVFPQPAVSSFPARPLAQPLQPMQAQPIVQAQALPQSAQVARRHLGGPKSLLYIASAAIIIGLVIGTAYAFVEKIGVFSRAPYTEKNIISGLLAKAGDIKTSSYLFAVSLHTEPREEGAEPFTIENSNQAEIDLRYAHDSERANDLQIILRELQSNQTYPATLQSIAKKVSAVNYYSETRDILDPSSQVEYSYALTPDKKDFKLSIAFETKEAVSAVKNSYSFASTTTFISGNTVTFTKGSSDYLYLSATPPKPFFVQMQEMVSYLPSELTANASVGAVGDWSKEDDADWKFNAKLNGDFGDLTYKFDVEALKKTGIYYLRINNMPSLFGSISSYKGMWVKIDPKAATSTSSYYDPLSYIVGQLPEAEVSYKKNRQEATDFLKKAAALADEEGLVAFKTKPSAERIEGRQLYRYDVAFKKDAFLPFAKKLLAEVENNAGAEVLPFIDQSFVDYLESIEFDQVFAYYEKNVNLTLFVDSDGFPAIIQYDVRLVPADTATGLKDKQIRLTFKITSSDINKSVDIEAPADAKTFQEIIDTSPIGSAMKEAQSKGNDASVKANLATILTQSSLVYDTSNTYGLAQSSCTAKAGTLWADVHIAAALKKADTDNGDGAVVCASSATAFSVTAQLNDGKYYCVDSNGFKKTTAKAPVKGALSCP